MMEIGEPYLFSLLYSGKSSGRSSVLQVKLDLYQRDIEDMSYGKLKTFAERVVNASHLAVIHLGIDFYRLRSGLAQKARLMFLMTSPTLVKLELHMIDGRFIMGQHIIWNV